MHLFGSLWLLSDSLTDFEASGYRGGFFFFFFPLVTDGQFEWTSPFLTQRDWASEDDEWGCFKTSFSSVSPSLHFPPCIRGGGEGGECRADFYPPARYLQMKEFLSSVFRTWPLWTGSSSHEHPLKPFVCSPSNGRHLTPSWGHVLKPCSSVYGQPWAGDTLHRDTELNFLAAILLLRTIPRENDHIFFLIVSCSLLNPFCIRMDMACVTTDAVKIEIVVVQCLHAAVMKRGLAPGDCHNAIKASTNQVIFLRNCQECFVFVCMINTAVR